MSFNLAIERLFISGQAGDTHRDNQDGQFQSRNREAFHFRVAKRYPSHGESVCFNLAIERLFISGDNRVFMETRPQLCFNLAIEMLFISGSWTKDGAPVSGAFQSRNRDAFHFR